MANDEVRWGEQLRGLLTPSAPPITRGALAAGLSLAVDHRSSCRLQPGARRATNFAHLLNYMHRTLVPAHEPPSNGPSPFRPPDCLRAAGFYFSGAAGSSGAAAVARVAALRFVSRRLSGRFAPGDPVRALAAQTLLAF